MVLPLLLLVSLGIVELSYVLYDQHVIIRLSREGSNLISRNTTLLDAGNAMKSMANPPVDFNSANSKLIFSVLTKLNASGQPNNGYVILYQRYEIGTLAATSVFTTGAITPPPSSWSAPDFYAPNPATDANLRVTNVPPNLVLNPGQFVYITEVYTRHALATPFSSIGISLPTSLYSIAYF
jgi:Flp pilus assembly protein TadG